MGPDYRQPPIAQPLVLKYDQGWQPMPARAWAQSGAWWEAFADAELSALVVEANANNLTLAQAAARYRAALAQRRLSSADYLPTLSAALDASRSGGSDSAHQKAACADSAKIESSQLFAKVRPVMCRKWWRDGLGRSGGNADWSLMTSPASPMCRYGSNWLTSRTAASSTNLASCSLAWCWQNSNSAPDGSFARTRAAAPQRSQRSALVNSGLVSVAVMAPP